MLRFLSFALIFALGCVQVPQMAAAAPSEITKLSVIPIQSGVNQIDDFAGDGRRAMIVEGWRDNGNAHGGDLFLVMLQSPSDHGNWNVVTVQRKPDELEREVVYDSPHTFEDAVSSVRFARGLVDGKPATLLIVATRDLAKAASLTDPAPVDIEFYRLVRNDLPGWPPDYFDLIETIRSAGPYCNSDLALTKEIGLPLPEPYAGPNQADGCPR
jgi:hypothetical protein